MKHSKLNKHYIMSFDFIDLKNVENLIEIRQLVGVSFCRFNCMEILFVYVNHLICKRVNYIFNSF